jgi:hypothetical protein
LIDKYKDFLKSKRFAIVPSGFDPLPINEKLFDWQKDVIAVAVKKGRYCLFTDTGTGKSAMQLEFASQVQRYTDRPVLILAPLAVTNQTKKEGIKFGYDVTVCRDQSDVVNGINITNYDMLEHFEPSSFSGIVLDESGILKHFNSNTRDLIIKTFRDTPYKLACSATPAPNDFMELGNHSEFMGVMTRTEMLSTFFYHDGGETSKWVLKGHAEDKFWEWVSNWAIVVRKPSDLGYENEGYDLPPLNVEEIIVKSEAKDIGGQLSLLPAIASTLAERREARRDSREDRCRMAVDLIEKDPGQWLLWCDLNTESEMLTQMSGGTEVKGSDDRDYKRDSLIGFSENKFRILISKPSIAGFGMNWQQCNNMVFVGLSDSYEMMYQAIRRCWRFGQAKPVNVYIITSEAEGAVRENIRRKEQQSLEMFEKLAKYSRASIEKEVRKTYRETEAYAPEIEMRLPEWIAA